MSLFIPMRLGYIVMMDLHAMRYHNVQTIDGMPVMLNSPGLLGYRVHSCVCGDSHGQYITSVIKLLT